MKLSNFSFDLIRNSVDIVDVVSQYVNLKNRGNNYLALCPFHNEKTPSFVVSSQKRIFHCFGCGAGGDVIKFVSEIENISYYEAALKLAKDYNIAVDFKTESKVSNFYEINNVVADIYHENLRKNFSKKDIKSFIEKRKITDEIIERFYLGYAPDSYNFILSRLKKKRIDLSQCEELGVIKKKKDYYDTFRNRIIFPIRNISGDVIAFGGRILNDDLPKYLNSPESKVYLKRKNLYGVFENKEFIRKENEVIVVEGYMDLIALWSNGVKNCVATLGTAFTKEQLALIKRFVENIVFLYDGDKAGVKAAVKGAVTAINEDFYPKLIYLPQGDDPDDFINKNGIKKFIEVKDSADDLVKFLKNIIFQKIDLKKFENKIRLIERLKKLYSDIDNPVYREHFIEEIGELLSIETKELKKYFTKNLPYYRVKPQKEEKRKIELNIESKLISVILKDVEQVNNVESKYFTNDNNVKLIKFLQEGKDFNFIITSDEFEETYKKHLRELTFAELLERNEFSDCYNRLKSNTLKNRLKSLTEQIREVEKSNNKENLLQLIQEKEHILKEIKDILN